MADYLKEARHLFDRGRTVDDAVAGWATAAALIAIAEELRRQNDTHDEEKKQKELDEFEAEGLDLLTKKIPRHRVAPERGKR